MAGVHADRNTAARRGVDRTMSARVLRLLAVAVLAIAAAGPVWAVKPSQLPEQWRTWLEDEVYPIISGEQRKAFLALETEAERSAFADRLWEEWAHERGMAISTFRRDYAERLEDCRNEFRNTKEDRARVLLLHGAPSVRKPIDCDSVFWPLEFWVWDRLEGIGDNVVILFFKPYGLGQFRLWDPVGDGRAALYNPSGWSAVQAWSRDPMSSMSQILRPELRCGDQDILRALDMAEYWLKDIRTRMAMDHAISPATGNQESAAARFLQFSTVLPKGATAHDFQLTSSIGNRRGSKVAVTLNARVPRAGLSTNKVGDVEVVQLDVTGEVSHEGDMVDRFRYAFTFPTAGATDFPVLIERDLRPGKYHLRMKVQDTNSTNAAVRELDLEVPVPELSPLPAPDAKSEEAVKRVAEAQEATLALQGPEGEGVTGVQRFTALAGPRVARVEFFLDSRPVLTKNRPPYEVQLDLGPLPRLASIVAVALDAKGQELDRRQIDVNVGRERFLVRLQPVGASDRKGGKVHASVAVNVPPDRKLARLELYWNELLAETLFAQPFQAWLPVRDDGSIGYLRALAVLEDGGQAEDVQFVNAPQYLTGVQVHTVELPVTVLESGGKPVEGLKESDFDISEDGVKQTISYLRPAAGSPDPARPRDRHLGFNGEDPARGAAGRGGFPAEPAAAARSGLRRGVQRPFHAARGVHRRLRRTGACDDRAAGRRGDRALRRHGVRAVPVLGRARPQGNDHPHRRRGQLLQDGFRQDAGLRQAQRGHDLHGGYRSRDHKGGNPLSAHAPGAHQRGRGVLPGPGRRARAGL